MSTNYSSSWLSIRNGAQETTWNDDDSIKHPTLDACKGQFSPSLTHIHTHAYINIL